MQFKKLGKLKLSILLFIMLFKLMYLFFRLIRRNSDNALHDYNLCFENVA
jgi:hypothetical protein